ncbi:hypothetical protein ACFFX1_24655 [Dactylosporangium sucinum]|uniref:YcxB-like protein domain-containing protein n=1 Tax=Dactylosporangium sucinum TaxID=1424081 RepID=A0A917UF70_9ACTN|nr:hypothetical protein [Dactylosporangium sucinum]GGM84911.1 hypothetical protein GCM10007977_103200 [Dactylosporangium sucinum]
MHISFTVPPDRQRARRQVRAAKRRKLQLLFVGGILLAAAGVALVVAGQPAGYAPVGVGVGLLVLPWLLPRAAAKARTGLLAETATYELTDTGVVATTPGFRGAYEWDGVDRVTDTGEFWVVTVKGSGVLAVPWTLMPPDDTGLARELLVARGLLQPGR